MKHFRVFIYANGLVLPVVVAVSCNTRSLPNQLQRVFALDFPARRADVWEGSTMVMQIHEGGIMALVGRAKAGQKPPAHSRTLH